ncbi:MAG: VanZ family protein [Saprospiraceae bacterium]
MGHNKITYAAILWTIVVFLVSVVSGTRIKQMNVIDVIGIDKVGHILFYTIMSYLWCKAICNNKREAGYIIFFCTSFGFLMEILQFYLSNGRTFEFLDAIANGIGVLTGVYLFQE